MEENRPKKRCVYCKELIDAEATVCPHCRNIQNDPKVIKNLLRTIIIVFIVVFVILTIFTFVNMPKFDY